MREWMELFNGRSLEGWTARGPHDWTVVGGVALAEDPKRFRVEPGEGILLNGDTGRTLDLHTEREHGSCELHLEFCVPRGSNSGVYLMGQYEVQILDSWGVPDTELKFGTNGGIYARWIEQTRTAYEGATPRVNASRAPGEWQSFDILYRAPRFDGSSKTANARFERVVHNGVLIHEDVECSGPTRGAWDDADIPLGPLRLQGDHGPVAFRNLRMRVLSDTP